MPHLVTFVYHTGLREPIFTAARLTGSWDAHGRPSTDWTSTPMTSFLDDGGSVGFQTTVAFPDATV